MYLNNAWYGWSDLSQEVGFTDTNVKEGLQKSTIDAERKDSLNWHLQAEDNEDLI